MEVEEIVDRNIPKVTAGTRIGEIRSMFNNGLPKGVVVFRNGEYLGVMEERKLMSSHISGDTNVERFSDPAPKLREGIGVRDAARMMIDGSSKVAPYFDQSDELVGVVTQNSILRAVKENLDVIDVEDIYTKNVVTVDEESTLAQATTVIRENGISRVPVEDEGNLVGIITTHDIMNYSVRSNNASTEGDKAGEKDDVSDLPATNAMSEPVETIDPNSSVRDAVDVMLESGYGGLVVENEDNQIAGIITKTDAIRSLTVTESESLPVQITNVNLMDTLNRDMIREEITDIVDKYKEMRVHYCHVRFHTESKASRRGQSLINCTIRIRTNKEEIGGSGQGYGSRNAFEVASDKLERNVLQVKGMNDPSTNNADEMNRLFRL